MADAKLKIIVLAEDKASGTLGGIGAKISGLDADARAGMGGIDGLTGAIGRFAGPVALGAAVLGVGKAAIGLETMREESAQLESRFTGLSGGTAKASAAMTAFDATLGNALTKDEKMATAAQWLGLGLASTAEEAATLTNQAMILGMDLGTLTQALETGRANGLVKYGIAVSDVATRAKVLQAANASLTDVEAKGLAIKEQLAVKSAAVAQAGGQAATSIKGLGNAWEDLKDAAADRVQLEVVIKDVTGELNKVTLMLRGVTDETKREIPVDLKTNEIAAAQRDLNALYDIRNQRQADYNALLKAGGPEAAGDWSAWVADLDPKIAAAQGKMADLRIELELAKARADTSGSSMVALGGNVTYAGAQATGAAPKVDVMAESVRGLADAYNLLAIAKSGSELFQGDIAGAGLANEAWALQAAAAAMQASYGTGLDYIGPTQLEANQYAGEQKLKKLQDAEEIARRTATLAKQGATRAASDYNQAFQTVATKVGGYFADAIGKAKGLLDVTGPGGNGKGLLEPGANGPFENIYRLLDVVKQGGTSPWAEQFKDLSRAQMQQIAEDFENGKMTDAVKKIIDVPALVQSLQDEQAGQKLRDAFYAEVAAQAGVGKSAVQAFIEPTGDQRTAIGTQATTVAADVAGELKGQAAQFAVTGGEWMTQLGAGIRGSIPNLTVAASEVVAAFLATVQAGVTGKPLPAAAAAAGAPAAGAPPGAGPASGIPGMAAGGIARGGVTLVGEQGPELVVLPGKSRVYSARDTERILAPGGSPAGSQAAGQTLNLTINVSGANRGEARIGVLEALRAAGVS